ncbi:MAG: hypothetical protein CMM56_07830 [Rhodospirillaceae bacterium]|nr:hypothetical protein [Rhodospirillaceae bacterium]|tara:strand:+ start:519 stop:1418 length:900 start_codon:yes stop_codon:yes gene_type:complete
MRAALICFVFSVIGVVTNAHAELHYLIVAGLGGEQRYQERFEAQAESMAQAALRSNGDDSNISLLIGHKASRESLIAELQRISEVITAKDQLAVFFIGHGTHDGEQYKFNLPGPDIDGETLASLLENIPATQQVVVNTTSASGAVLESWASEGRTLITATKSPGERNATRFGAYWAAALSSDEADINKNGAVTVREAFDFAATKVAESYESEGLLATEHPAIVGENSFALNLALLQERVLMTAELEILMDELDELERDVETLRQNRGGMDNDVYLDALQSLLLELALVQREIDDVRGIE